MKYVLEYYWLARGRRATKYLFEVRDEQLFLHAVAVEGHEWHRLDPPRLWRDSKNTDRCHYLLHTGRLNQKILIEELPGDYQGAEFPHNSIRITKWNESEA